MSGDSWINSAPTRSTSTVRESSMCRAWSTNAPTTCVFSCLSQWLLLDSNTYAARSMPWTSLEESLTFRLFTRTAKWKPTWLAMLYSSLKMLHFWAMINLKLSFGMAFKKSSSSWLVTIVYTNMKCQRLMTKIWPMNTKGCWNSTMFHPLSANTSRRFSIQRQPLRQCILSG